MKKNDTFGINLNINLFTQQEEGLALTLFFLTNH